MNAPCRLLFFFSLSLLSKARLSLIPSFFGTLYVLLYLLFPVLVSFVFSLFFSLCSFLFFFLLLRCLLSFSLSLLVALSPFLPLLFFLSPFFASSSSSSAVFLFFSRLLSCVSSLPSLLFSIFLTMELRLLSRCSMLLSEGVFSTAWGVTGILSLVGN